MRCLALLVLFVLGAVAGMAAMPLLPNDVVQWIAEFQQEVRYAATLDEKPPSPTPEPTATPTRITRPEPTPTPAPTPTLRQLNALLPSPTLGPTPTRPGAAPTVALRPTISLPTPTPTPRPRVTATPTPRPTPTLHPTATPTPRSAAIRVHGSVWECFADRPNRRDPSNTFLAGCSGWSTPVIQQWEKDRLAVYVEPQGDEGYRALAVEALEYLSPILRLDFVYGASEREADLLVYAGVPSSWYAAIGQPPYCGIWVSGCGGPDRVIGNTILQASFSVWYDLDNDESDIKHTAIHEALHALTGVDHSTNFSSIMSDNSALRLPYLLPWEEAMYRLYSDPRVTPGMSINAVRELVEVVREAPTIEQGLMAAVEGYLRFVKSDDVQFRVDVKFPEDRCDVHNYMGTVLLSGIDEYGYKHPDLSQAPAAQTNIEFDIERLLVHIARSRNAIATETADGVELRGSLSDFGLLDVSWYTGYTLDYGVMLDSHGYVQSFRMDWEYQVTGNSCTRTIAVGSGFTYR